MTGTPSAMTMAVSGATRSSAPSSQALSEKVGFLPIVPLYWGTVLGHRLPLDGSGDEHLQVCARGMSFGAGDLSNRSDLTRREMSQPKL